MKTTLLVLTHNEIEAIKIIMPRIKREWVDQILIVDGNSTDGTVEYAKKYEYEIFKQFKKGLHFAYKEVWPIIKGDVVITFSPDGNSIPELIPELIKKIKEGYDMVIVSRYLSPARSYDDTIITGFGNWMFTNLINFIHKAYYTDAMVIYRAYRKNLFYELDLHLDKSYRIEKLLNTKLGIEPLMSVRVAKRKLKYTEIPGDEPIRIGGKSKLQIVRWGICYLYQVIREIFLWK